MSAPVTAIILPGGIAGELAATVAAFRAEAGENAEILALDGPAAAGDEIAEAGIGLADVTEIAGSDRLLVFYRAGDRPLPGALEARLRTFAAYPAAGLAIAGHVIVTASGDEVRRVGPPPAGAVADEILIRRTAEAAAVLVRAEHLDEGHLDLLARPFGDIVVWSRLAHEAGYTRSGELAAEVRLDPDRHGQASEAWLGLLLERIASSSGPDRDGDSGTRRELLRRLYLAPEDPPGPVDLATLFAGKLTRPEDAAAVIADLQWIAERQSEALELERVRWADGDVKAEDLPPVTINEEIIEAQAKLGETGARMAQLDNALRRLETEVYRRDAIISELQNLPLAEAHAVGEEPDEVAGERETGR